MCWVRVKKVMAQTNAYSRIITMCDIYIEPAVAMKSLHGTRRILMTSNSRPLLVFRSLLFKLCAVIGYDSCLVSACRRSFLLTTNEILVHSRM